MLFLNQEASDTLGGPRPLDEEPPMFCPTANPDGELVNNCEAQQGTVASQEKNFIQPGGRFNYLPPSNRSYVIGPHPDSERSIQSVVATRFETFQDPEEHIKSLRWIFNSGEKPVNTGAHFSIFMASNCIGFRDEAVKQIAQLGIVHEGDHYQSCADGTPDPPGGPYRIDPRPNATSRSAVYQNWEIFRNYKFVIAMENTYRDGYVSKKLLVAFQSGSVPIWYGGVDALEIFNTKAFIYYNVENPNRALEQIKFLLDYPEEYEKVLREPILKDGSNTIEKYFSLRDEIGGGHLKNRIRRMMGVDDF